MNKITLLDAWKLWLSGSQVHDSLLWGINILWWSRIGKIVELIAALTIVADIIGPDRLRTFGNSLHAAFTLDKAGKYLENAQEWRRAMRRYVSVAVGTSEEKEALAATETFNADKLNYFVSFVITLIGAYFVWSHLSWWLKVLLIPISVLFFSTLLVSLSPFITIALIFILTVIGVSIDSVFIEPLAWILERQYIDKWVKIVSVILLLLGFHFDLLAS